MSRLKCPECKILYLYPFEFSGDPNLSCNLLRVSNYLNSRKSELGGEIEEEYLDLRMEELPPFNPEYIDEYRIRLRELLQALYRRFEFNVVAITCQTSFMYLNTIEVANMIKHQINLLCYIIVGGFHPTLLPQDFFPKGIPQYFSNTYPNDSTPIDYIAIDEGELPFFHFIQDILSGDLKVRKNLKRNPRVLKREILEDLNDLPIINLSLFKKYKEIFNEIGEFNIQLNRGCPFTCKFCPSSNELMRSYQLVRYRELGKCMRDLKALASTSWLTLKRVFIVDPIFFPKRSLKNEFFNEFNKISHEITYQIYLFDRIDMCTVDDLKMYKKYDMIPDVGFESASKKMLSQMLKTSDSKINDFLDKVVEIIRVANEIDLHVIFLYMIGLPGTDKQVMEEEYEFFFSKKYEGLSLLEKYKMILNIEVYGYLYGSVFYENSEALFGTKFYSKKWWKIFNKEQVPFSYVMRANEGVPASEIINHSRKLIKNIYRTQLKMNTPYYTLQRAGSFGSTFRNWERIAKQWEIESSN